MKWLTKLAFNRKRQEAWEREKTAKLSRIVLAAETQAHTRQAEEAARARMAAFDACSEADKLAAANLLSMARGMGLFSLDSIESLIHSLLRKAPKDLLDSAERKTVTENAVTTSDNAEASVAKAKSVAAAKQPSSETAASSVVMPCCSADNISGNVASDHGSNAISSVPHKPKRRVFAMQTLFESIREAATQTSPDIAIGSWETFASRFADGKDFKDPNNLHQRWIVDLNEENGFSKALKGRISRLFGDRPSQIIEEVWRMVLKILDHKNKAKEREITDPTPTANAIRAAKFIARYDIGCDINKPPHNGTAEKFKVTTREIYENIDFLIRRIKRGRPIHQKCLEEFDFCEAYYGCDNLDFMEEEWIVHPAKWELTINNILKQAWKGDMKMSAKERKTVTQDVLEMMRYGVLSTDEKFMSWWNCRDKSKQSRADTSAEGCHHGEEVDYDYEGVDDEEDVEASGKEGNEDSASLLARLSTTVPATAPTVVQHSKVTTATTEINIATDPSERQSLRLLMDLCRRRLGELPCLPS